MGAGVVLALFFAVFLCVFVQAMLFNGLFSYNPLLQLALLLVWVVFVGVLGFAALKHKAFVLRHKFHLLALLMLFVFAVQTCVGVVTAQTPDHDYGKVYNGALIYATQGDVPAFAEYKDYFHHFSNNMGAFLLLQQLFRCVSALGLDVYYPAAVVLGHLLFAAAILFTFLYLDKAFGPGAALCSLLFFAAFLPVYFQSSILYTDTLSIWIAPALLYLCLRAKHAPTRPARLGLYALAGVLLGLGHEIKSTVLIVGVAVVVEALARNWKQGLALAAVSVAAALLVAGGFSLWARATIYDPARADEAMPITFWPMMGLTGDGSYNAHDEWVVNAQVFGKEARTQLHLQVMGERLREMGPLGTLRFLATKTVRTFGSGNADVYNMLVRGAHNPGHWIYNILSAEGAWFRYFNNLAQCVYLSFYVFGLGGVLALRKNAPMKQRYFENFAPFLALVGFYLFMLIWEANHRQLVNQWPLYIIVAAAGIAAAAPLAAQALAMCKRRGKGKGKDFAAGEKNGNTR